MPIKVGHASINENNETKNGQAGDQTDKEVCIRPWYSKPWSFILRCTDLKKAEMMAEACEKGCANNKIGYDQNQRNTLRTQAKKVHYDLSKISTPCECDCSSFLTVCAEAAEINIPYNGTNAPTTSTMRTAFASTGMFDVLTDSKYLTSDKYLKRGDILVKPGSHTVMALDNGSAVSVNVPTPISSTVKCIDVSSYQGNIKWEQVKAAGVNKTILKVIRKDLNPDKKFEEYYSGCKSANIEVTGVYNYSYATTSAKAKTDAQKVLSILNGRKVKVWLDVEDKCQQGIGSLLKDIINTYQNVIESVGYEFGVYTGMSFYQSYIKPYENQIKCKDWWIARYYNGYNKMNVSVNPNESYNPKSTIGRDIYGWQYTSSGQVPGINGNVDMNIIYKLSNNSNDNNFNSNSSSSTFSEFLGKITATSLNIRSGTSTAYSRVGSYVKGAVVHIIGRTSNGWYQTDKGYISNEYVKQLIGQVYNCGGLNVRSTPDSRKKNVIKSLKPSDEIVLLFDNGSWYKCKLNDGTIGWVSKKYIKIL